MMMHGRNTGKKQMAVRIVKHAFEIIHLLTDKNPLEVTGDYVNLAAQKEKIIWMMNLNVLIF